MKHYLLLVPVVKATGTQTYEVDAHSEEEALARFARGEAACTCEELEAVELGKPDVYEEDI